MAKADRLERYDNRRLQLEGEYRSALVLALEDTARGVWGLFDHKPDKQARARVAPVLEALCDIADEIDELRDQLGQEPFALHQTFLASRGPVAADAVGEPRQARIWLDRLAAAII